MISWKLIINKYLKQLINGLIAGILLSIGTLAFLYCKAIDQIVLGGFLFGFGFFFIALYGYDLFTNKVGYSVENKVVYLLDLLFALIGNYLGTWLVALIFKMTNIFDSNLFAIFLNELFKEKSQTGMVFNYFGMALISGIILYLSYNTYKKAEQPIARFLSIFITAILISVLGLFELTSDLFVNEILCLNFGNYGHLFLTNFYVLVGNSIGAMIIPLFRKLKGVLKSI